MSETIDSLLGGTRVVPVAVVHEEAHAEPLAEALIGGGLPCIEVTFRTAAASKVLARMSRVPGMLVGAGSVRYAEQVRAAVDSGAQFVVSPGFGEQVVGAARDCGVPVLPGVATASDILRCLDVGVDIVKLFPAESLGGLPTLAALSAPFGEVRFVPTGGLTESNAGAYLAHPAVRAVGGSWMLPAALLRAGDFSGIAELTRRAVQLVLEPSS